jgi:hypothetical protein
LIININPKLESSWKISKFIGILLGKFLIIQTKKYCFVGAGLSAFSGLSTWCELIDKMQLELEDSLVTDLYAKTLEDFKKARQDRDFLLAAKCFNLYNVY